MKTKRAFTLIELLTVIAIIGILAAIIIPAVGAVRDNAIKTKTRAMYGQWITALEQFRQEYGYIPSFTPFPGSESDEFYLTLTGTGGTENTRNISFYSFPGDALEGSEGSRIIVDAFGNPNIGMGRDTNRDGRINEFSSTEGAPAENEVRASVIFWSIPDDDAGFPIVKSWN